MLATFKILSDPSRLRLLRILSQGDFTVQDLTQILKMGQSRISHHLKSMVEAGMLRVTKQGTWHYYRLAPAGSFLEELWPVIEPRLQSLPDLEADRQGVLEVMAERRQRSQRFFDQHAEDWDRLHVDLLALPDYRTQLLELVDEGGLILEVGVGTGRLLTELARQGERVVGIDHAPAMVEAARRRIQKDSLPNVEVRLAEMVHLPFTDGSADTLVMNQVLHHAEQPELVLAEVARVLRPGGRLVIADLSRHAHDWTREQLADLWLGFEQHELRNWLAKAGMAVSCLKQVDGDTRQPSVLLISADKS